MNWGRGLGLCNLEQTSHLMRTTQLPPLRVCNFVWRSSSCQWKEVVMLPVAGGMNWAAYPSKDYSVFWRMTHCFLPTLYAIFLTDQTLHEVTNSLYLFWTPSGHELTHSFQNTQLTEFFSESQIWFIQITFLALIMYILKHKLLSHYT